MFYTYTGKRSRTRLGINGNLLAAFFMISVPPFESFFVPLNIVEQVRKEQSIFATLIWQYQPDTVKEIG